jgi:hypothetical protein
VSILTAPPTSPEDRRNHPAWCVECTNPDPGVTDHYSAKWSGGSPDDRDAGWHIYVTQRIVNDTPHAATVDIEASGSYASTAALVSAIGEAQTLATEINARLRWRRGAR